MNESRIPKSRVPESGIHPFAGLISSAPATCHTFSYFLATRLLDAGYDIRTIQELPGHSDVHTAMIYTHVLHRGGLGVHSPVDTFIEMLDAY